MSQQIAVTPANIMKLVLPLRIFLLICRLPVFIASLSTRIISEAQQQRLEDLSAEALLSGLSVGIAEKDIHVTELLRSLSTLEVQHSHFQRTREIDLKLDSERKA
jgi:hypothetical protein